MTRAQLWVWCLLGACAGCASTDEGASEGGDAGPAADAATVGRPRTSIPAGCLQPPGGDNPDPRRIAGDPGDPQLEVALGDRERDADNVQWALDHVGDGGTVALCEGELWLGEGEDRRSLRIARGLRLRGAPPRDGAPTTTLRGGGDGAEGFPSQGSGGVLQVHALDGEVEIERLAFRGFLAEVAYVTASRGFVFQDNEVSEPASEPAGAVAVVDVLWSRGPEAQGRFVARGNRVDLGAYDGMLPWDEQLLALYHSNHDQIVITGNRFVGRDEGIEVVRNGYDEDNALYPEAASRPAAEIFVEENELELTQTLDTPWPGRFGVLVLGNANTSQIGIRGNFLTLEGAGSAGGEPEGGYAFCVAGERVAIEGNAGRFLSGGQGRPAGAFLLGLAGSAPGTAGALGGPLLDSRVADNVWRGGVVGPTVSFVANADGRNESSGNTLELGVWIAGLGGEPTVLLAEGVRDNVLTGDTGTVQDDSGNDTNRY